RTPIVSERELSAVAPRLYVRHPAAVFWRFVVSGGVTAFLFLVAAIFVRKAGVQGDPYLIPLAFLLSGLGVLILFSARDPIRDAPVYAHHLAGIWMGLAAMLFGALLPTRVRRNMRRYTYVWAMAAIALLVALRLFGRGPEGVRVNLGFFQPVELIKLFLIFF